MGKKTSTVRFTVAVDKRQREAIDKLCVKERRTLNSWIGFAIEEKLARSNPHAPIVSLTAGA